jgi:hypothetical protein
MTPKEKAEEMYRTYIDYTFGDFNCIQCALIAVDEIRKTISYCYLKDEISYVEYWEEVKQELEKLNN